MILMVIMMFELTKQLHNAFVKQICYAGAAARETVIDTPTPCKGQSHASRNIYLAYLRLYISGQGAQPALVLCIAVVRQYLREAA
jgi:hypothetical protein